MSDRPKPKPWGVRLKGDKDFLAVEMFVYPPMPSDFSACPPMPSDFSLVPEGKGDDYETIPVVITEADDPFRSFRTKRQSGPVVIRVEEPDGEETS